MSSPTLSKILIIRNDKLGDFTLSLPTFALLKYCLPAVELHTLVPQYTRPIAEACPYIDTIITDPGKSASKRDRTTLLSIISQQRYSAAITLYSTTRIGWLLLRSHIPIRVAPATKIAQLFYNNRIRQRRSQSRKPEFEYNLDLARYLIEQTDVRCEHQLTAPYLLFSTPETNALRQIFCTQHNIAADKRLVFIHSGSGGSANNLNIAQYIALAQGLALEEQNHIVLSAGPGEFEMAQHISSRLENVVHCVYESNQGLSLFAQHINFADVFISGSTGPLHVAGALNRPTVGFYTNRQSATSLRWQTLNNDDRRLAFSPPESADAEDMAAIDLEAATIQIEKMLTRLYPLTTRANP